MLTKRLCREVKYHAAMQMCRACGHVSPNCKCNLKTRNWHVAVPDSFEWQGKWYYADPNAYRKPGPDEWPLFDDE